MSEILKDTNLWRSLESICYVLILMFIFFQLFKTHLFRVASCCVATVIDSLNDPTFPRIPNEKLRFNTGKKRRNDLKFSSLLTDF